MHTDKYAIWKVSHAFASDNRRRSRFVSIRVVPVFTGAWFALVLDKRRQTQ